MKTVTYFNVTLKDISCRCVINTRILMLNLKNAMNWLVKQHRGRIQEVFLSLHTNQMYDKIKPT